MKFLFTAMLSIGALLITVMYPANVNPSDHTNPTHSYDDRFNCAACPQMRFLERHLCSTCRTLEDAADFTRFLENPHHTNTIFFGEPPFEVKTYKKDRCGNTVGVPVATCSTIPYNQTYKKLGNYFCRFEGKTCYGEHAISTGHLFFGEIRCTS